MPALHLNTQVDPTTFGPGQVFSLCHTLSNDGFAAGGSFVQLTIPLSSTMQGVRLNAADGRGHFYQASQLYNTQTLWRVATGTVIEDSPRELCWRLEMDNNAPDGAYLFESQAGHQYQGQTEWLADPIRTYLFINGYTVYTPIILK